MKKQIFEKTYEVSQETKRVLDCKMLNEQLYDAIYEVVNDYYPSEADKVMEENMIDAHNRIDDFLTHYSKEVIFYFELNKLIPKISKVRNTFKSLQKRNAHITKENNELKVSLSFDEENYETKETENTKEEGQD